MRIIITKIGCRIGQSCKIRHNVLVCTSVWEPSRGINNTNSKMGRGLLATTTKLGTLRGCVAEGEAQMTHDVMLKIPVRRPRPRTRGPSILLTVARFQSVGAEEWKPWKSNLCWWLWRLLLGRQLPRERPLLRLKLGLCWYWERWAEGSRDGVGSSGGFAAMDWREVLCKNSWGKEMAMKISTWQRFCFGHEAGYQDIELTTKATKYIAVKVFKGDRSSGSSQFIK